MPPSSKLRHLFTGDLRGTCKISMLLFIVIVAGCLDYGQASSRNATTTVVVSDLVTDQMSTSEMDATVTTPSLDLMAKDSSVQVKKFKPPLPECAAQQVCNSMFVNANLTRQLCACHGDFASQCSTRMDPFDGHSLELTTSENRKVYTLLKLCEPSTRVRMCTSPRDWTLLALQSVRTGKAHYVVVCRCPKSGILDGPVLHDNPPYARVPGIRVYGMLCSFEKRNRRHKIQDYPPPPWDYIYNLLQKIKFF